MPRKRWATTVVLLALVLAAAARADEGKAPRARAEQPANAPPARIVSLAPSVTETLLVWGVTPVACTRFCEQPDLPHVGGTKDPDIAAILALAPDLVVVCDEENRREGADSEDYPPGD